MRKLVFFVFLFTTIMVCAVYAQEERPFEFGIYGGWATGAYDAKGGNYGFGASLDVPLIKKDPLGNMLSGELFISWNHGERGYDYIDQEGNPQHTTLFAQTITVNADFKYTLRDILPSVNLYALGGVGVYVYEVDWGERLPAEEVFVGVPAGAPGTGRIFGWAHTDFGFQVGGGIDYKILPALSVGFDYRANLVTRRSENNFHQLFGKIAFHF